MATTPIASSTAGLNFDFLNGSIAKVVQTKESDLRTLIGSMGDNPTTADLLSLQQQVQQWTLTTQVQSTVIKEVADALKGIVQKAG
ncbi:EscF/YscF/HrpA family type III secretion system needle major subunit [Aquabacterium sp.]|uniref:EscF/YscF/HrpA family type III secretion system needle major subunit n=1 Tax=Aquabacterium sp. TaxID=1872578 RepID=UPI002BFBF2C4|nr:EscF/YscF/HrpA family type III secretion system needle major subunit [Aquabacterium sp.]HSW03472.1 EscF/YscF/HrpA family type III secretion system needle major subunit [Aquabacterium sp.]